ncbi:hypothetical protein ACFYN3_35680 [Streptomyces lavendulae]
MALLHAAQEQGDAHGVHDLVRGGHSLRIPLVQLAQVLGHELGPDRVDIA